MLRSSPLATPLRMMAKEKVMQVRVQINGAIIDVTGLSTYLGCCFNEDAIFQDKVEMRVGEGLKTFCISYTSLPN